MSVPTVEALKAAISNLPETEKAALASWLNVQMMDTWDQQMQRDFSPGARGMKLAEEFQREAAEGPVEPMEKGFAQRRRP